MCDKKNFFDLLKLARCKNVGPKTFKDLLNMYGCASVALSNLKKVAGDSYVIVPDSRIKQELQSVKDFDSEIIAYNNPQYPKLLSHIPDNPPVITIKGDINLLKKCDERKTIAVVGSRTASITAKHITQALVRELVDAGYVIVSGMARGIDTVAHKSCLDAGGKTIAVIAGGINNIYPAENKDLYNQIHSNGCIVSEGRFGESPMPYHFSARNRIISGMSIGVLVVEAKVNSGSLVTVRYANSHGREVFAVPGSPLDPRNSGCNKLIQDGAVLVQSADDIVETLQQNHYAMESEHDWLDSSSSKLSNKINVQSQHRNEDVSEVKNFIFESVSYAPVDVDELLLETQSSVNVFMQALLALELEGKLSRVYHNKVIRVSE